jgi:hypothetical protein
MLATVPHIKKIINADRPLSIGVDTSGYYITFDNTPAGLLDLESCVKRLNGERLFGQYIIRAEAFPKGRVDASTPKRSLSSLPSPSDLDSRRKLGDEISVGTGSTTSSGTKVPKCHICKGRAEDEPLIECQSVGCTRRYHRHCLGNAAPESSKDWRCHRCVQKGVALKHKRTFSDFTASEDKDASKVSSKDEGIIASKKPRLDDAKEESGESPPRTEARHLKQAETRTDSFDRNLFAGVMKILGVENRNPFTPSQAPKTIAETPRVPGEVEDSDSAHLENLVHQSFAPAGSKSKASSTKQTQPTRFKYTRTKVQPAAISDVDSGDIALAELDQPRSASVEHLDGTETHNQTPHEAPQEQSRDVLPSIREQLGVRPTRSIAVSDLLSHPQPSESRKPPEEDPAFAAFTQDLARTINESSINEPTHVPGGSEAKSHKLPTRRGFRKQAPTTPEIELCSQCKVAKVPKRPGGEAPLCINCKSSSRPAGVTKKPDVERTGETAARAVQSIESDDEGDSDLVGHKGSDTIVLDIQTAATQSGRKSLKPGKLPVSSSDGEDAGHSPRTRPSGSTAYNTGQRRVVTRPSQRRKAISDFDLGDSHYRPKWTYVRLIGMALLAAPGHRLQPISVPQWIHDNIPGYDMNEGRWKESIKATMNLNSQNKYGMQLMTRVPCKEGDGGSGQGYWYVLLPELVGKIARWDSVNKCMIMPSGDGAPMRIGGDQDRDCDGVGGPEIGDAILIADDDHASDRSNINAGSADEEDGDGDTSDAVDETDHHDPAEAMDWQPSAATIEVSRTIRPFSRSNKSMNESGQQSASHSTGNSPRVKQGWSTGRLKRPPSKRGREARNQSPNSDDSNVAVPGGQDGTAPDQPHSKKDSGHPAVQTRTTSKSSATSSSLSIRQKPQSSLHQPAEKPLSKSLFATWPQYLPIDPIHHAQQIQRRPSRKQLFGKPPLHSRLGAADITTFFHATNNNGTTAPVAVSTGINTTTDNLPDNVDAANDPRNWRSDATSVRHCASVEEFFGLNAATTLVPMVSGTELCFKREVDTGRRAKVLYHTGV